MFYDTAQITGSARITKDGSLVAEVYAARTGIQDYLGAEIDKDNTHGLRDKGVVKVYRPESEVFQKDSLASYTGAPVTISHPPVPVDATNWRDYGRGEIHGDIVRDGGKVRVPIIVRDHDAVTSATTTHKQISMGYSAEMVFPQDGKHPDGTICDAYQTGIRINHIAFVPAARGGPELTIIDERKPLHLLTDGIAEAKAWLKKAIALHKKHMDGTAPTTGPAGEKSQMLMMEQMENALSALDGESPASRMKMDFNPKELLMKIKIGDAEVDATNGDAVRIAVDALNTKLADAQTRASTAETDLATATASVVAKDGEIAALNAKLADATVTPEKLQAMADARSKLLDSARAVVPALVADGKSDADIRKEVVTAKLGDAAKDMSDSAIEGAFAVLAADGKSEIKPLGTPKVIGDAKAASDAAYVKSTDFNSWRNS